MNAFSFDRAAECDVTLTIVNTENRDLLDGCLRTINETVGQASYEVIVVDNASTDGSVEMVERKYPQVTLIRNDNRLGYGESHNKAICRARGRYVLVLNEDMEIHQGAVDRMIVEADRIPDLGAMGCRLLNPDGSLQHSCFRFPTLGTELFEAVFPYTVLFSHSRLRSKMYWWGHSEMRQVDIVVGCCMLVRRKTIEEVGAFDPAFFVYSEEHDWCKRLAGAGLRNFFLPDAEMVHFGGQTSKRMSLRMALVQLDSRTKYFLKHHGVIRTWMLRAILLASAGLRVVGWSAYLLVRGRSDKGAIAKLQEYWSSLKFVATWKRSALQQ